MGTCTRVHGCCSQSLTCIMTERRLSHVPVSACKSLPSCSLLQSCLLFQTLSTPVLSLHSCHNATSADKAVEGSNVIHCPRPTGTPAPNAQPGASPSSGAIPHSWALQPGLRHTQRDSQAPAPGDTSSTDGCCTALGANLARPTWAGCCARVVTPAPPSCSFSCGPGLPFKRTESL